MARSNGNGGCFVAVVLCIGLYACYHDSGSKQAAQQAALSGQASPSVIQGAAASVDPDPEFDEDAARDAARDDLAGVTYEGEHGSFDCTDDCSGHEAGWTAAQDETVECDGGAAGSFGSGCAAYEEAIEERVEQARDAFEQGDGAFEE